MTNLAKELTTASQPIKNESSDGIVDQVVRSSFFLFEPWFMGIAVSILIFIIVLSILYKILCRSKSRRHSREAILNINEEQSLNETDSLYKSLCGVITVCLISIFLIVGVNLLVYHMRHTGQSLREIWSNVWSLVLKYATEPWFFGILFGTLLLIAVLVSVYSIIKENKSKKTKGAASNRRPKKSLFSKPWFIAFLCALVVIVILSVLLFYFSCRQQGEKFMETASRFFLFEPWFFGIVVGVVLLALIIFNLYRILRGNGENYSVHGNEPLQCEEVAVESQGFDEYPSKSANSDLKTPMQEKTNATNLDVGSQAKNQVAAPNKPSGNDPKLQPSLSIQLNEGNFYDEKQFHDEDDSMAEYGLGENDQFNDEGSFIGLYNRDRIQNYMAQFNKNNLNN